jgi:ABC-type sugar transport system, periplasmic component
MAKRLISIFLAAALLVSICAGCANKSDDSKTVTESSSETAEPESETKTDYFATLPDYDFDGKTCTFLCRTTLEYEIAVDSEDGEIVNDAIYARNLRVSEAYNTAVDYVAIPGAWSDASSFQSAINTAVKAGDDSYDAVAVYMAYGVPLASAGDYMALNNISTIDTGADWWVQSLVENNTVYGNLYFIIGDLSLTMWSYIYAIFFNKQIAEDYGIANPYQTVKDGNWTLDKLIELSKLVSQDVNNDDKYDMDDKYGFITNIHSMRSLVTSFEIPFTEHTDDGGYELVFYNEHTVDVFNQLYEFVNGNNSSFILDPNIDHAGGSYLSKIFIDNRALFMTYTLDMTELLRDMKSDFGILPMPKYDENQAEYMSHSYDGASVFAVPVSASDYKFSGAMLDGLSAESKNTVVPAFYDTKLMTKVTRDNDSAEMLDIIRKDMTYDFGYVHSMSLDYIFSMFGDMIGTKNNTFASTYEKKAKSLNKLLETLLKNYAKVAETQASEQ